MAKKKIKVPKKKLPKSTWDILKTVPKKKSGRNGK